MLPTVYIAKFCLVDAIRLDKQKYLLVRLTKNIAKYLFHLAYHNLINTIEDPVAAEITTRLSNNFRLSLEKELQKKHNAEEIQTLLKELRKLA